MPRCKQTGPRAHCTRHRAGLTVLAAVSPVVCCHCCRDVYHWLLIASFLAARCESSVSRGNVCRVSAGCTSERGWVVTACERSRRLVFIERPSPGVTRSGDGRGRGRGRRSRSRGALARARSAGPLRARLRACRSPPHRMAFYCFYLPFAIYSSNTLPHVNVNNMLHCHTHALIVQRTPPLSHCASAPNFYWAPI